MSPETPKKQALIIFVASVLFCFLTWGASAATVQISTPDNLNRLTKIEYGNGLVINYTYDANGNRLTRTVTNTTVAPSIGIQPVAQTVAPGQSVTFTVVATANPAPAYQWKKNGVSIAGATSASYTINSVSASDAGQYTVAVTNFGGLVTSATVSLTVQTPAIPTIDSPLLAGAAVGEPFTYAVTASNRPTSFAATNLPPGLTIGSLTGVISGTPTTPGTYAVTLSAVNPGGTSNATLSLTVLPATTVVTLVGSLGTSGTVDGLGTAARFNGPTGIAADTSGNLYVADAGNSAIRKITPSAQVSIFAGLAGTSGSVEGFGTAARFSYPCSIAIDSSGNLFVTDAGNYSIRKITPAGQTSTFAGSAGISGAVDAIGTAARFDYPCAIVCTKSNDLYVAEFENHTIRKVTAAGVVTTIIGIPGVSGSADGSGSAARLNHPVALALDAQENLYIADGVNCTIRKATFSGSSVTVSTIAGKTGMGGTADGVGTAARFYFPRGIVLGSDGLVYVVDFNHTLRALNPTNQLVTTVAGSAALPGAADGTGVAVRFCEPFGMARDANGFIYIADEQNHAVRTTTSGPSFLTHPQSQTVVAGTNVTFTASATGAPTPTFQWFKNNVTVSGATAASLTISKAQSADAATYKVTATNIVGNVTSNAAMLTVTAPPSTDEDPTGADKEKGGGGGLPGAAYFFALVVLAGIRRLNGRRNS